MKKGIIKAVVLLLAFFAAVITFGYFTNQNSVNLTVEMSEATYPVLTMYYKDYSVGQLYGYRDAMEDTSIRDTLTVVNADRQLSVVIDTYGTAVDELGYEIRAMDSNRLIANRVCTDYETNEDELLLDLVLENLLEEEQEYRMIFLLKSGNETIHYYTRLLLTTDENLENYLAFVTDFHEATFDSGREQELTTYLEPDGTTANDNLHEVTIHSSLQEVTWADFSCMQLGDCRLSLKELSNGYGVITADYVVTHTGDGGEIEYYNVREAYRVSYNAEGERCYLHDFNRQLDQIFRADGANFEENYINLGIRDGDVEYARSENGQVTAFVQEGELWSYSEENDTLHRIFSFRGYEGMDERENHDGADISILNISEGGSVDFAVYGYMNRGIHEGECGILVCHYDVAAGTVEELLFIKSYQSQQRLQTNMGGVLYENAQGILFCMMQGSIFRIDTADGEIECLAAGLGSDSYKVSADDRLLVWQSGGDDKEDLIVLDLETEIQHTIPANGKRLYPIGFLSEDFVYGAAEESTEAMTDGSIPMSEVCIYDAAEGETIKDYQEKKYYITKVDIDGYAIDLTRVKRIGDTYVEAEPDTILNHKGEGLLEDEILEYDDGVKQTVIRLSLSDVVEHNSANVITAKEVLLEEPKEPTLELKEPWQGYYVYARGEEYGFYSDLADAIEQADENMGVVTDETLSVIWERARPLVCMPLTIPEELDEAELTAVYPEAFGYELKGILLTQTFYYVSGGIPVVITDEDGEQRLLIGYDSTNVWMEDVKTKSITRETIEAAQQTLEAQGVTYTCYIH